VIDAIVLGAGAAGLRAGAELLGKRLTVLVVEARDRVGGRVHSVEDRELGRVVELGAEFVHGNPGELKRAKLKLEEMNGRQMELRDGELRDVTSQVHSMLGKLAGRDISGLRKCVSAGEALPKGTFETWRAATGITILDGIGATEMLHIFIGSPEHEVRPGATGRPVAGYEARILDGEGREVPPGTVGRLAVRGPTGCRYLADDRQRKYVQDGWNVTGDTYVMDADGYFWYQARSDDMIISAGYNIAGPEVEAVLLAHPAVAECGVVGAPDAERGQIIKAYVVLRQGESGDAALTRALQEHVKATIAPYKYPRAIDYVTALPRTETGKLQRFALRRLAAEGADCKLAS